MANFPGLVLTTTGRHLQAKAQVGATLSFTRVALGDGTSDAPDTMNTLDNERLSLSIQELEVVGDGTSRMRVIMTNESLDSGFFVRELGVFAEDPDTGKEVLYSYTTAGNEPDFLPAGGGATLVENVFDLYTVVGNAQNVTAKINSYAVIATRDWVIDVAIPTALANRVIYCSTLAEMEGWASPSLRDGQQFNVNNQGLFTWNQNSARFEQQSCAAISWHSQTISHDVVIPPGANAFTHGPVVIAPGVDVTISPGATWRVI